MSATNRFLNSFNEYTDELDNYRQQAYEIKELAQTSPEKIPQQLFQTFGEPLAAHLLSQYGPEGASAAKNWITDKINSTISDVKSQIENAKNNIQDVGPEWWRGEIQGRLQDLQSRARGAAEDLQSRVQGAAEDLQSRVQGAVVDAQGRAQSALNQVQEGVNNAQQQAQRITDVAQNSLDQARAAQSDGVFSEDQPFRLPSAITTENPPVPDMAIPNGAADAAEGIVEQAGGFLGRIRGLLSGSNVTSRLAQVEPEQMLSNPFRTGSDYESWSPLQQTDYQDIINGRVSSGLNLSDSQFSQAIADRASLVQRGIARALPGEEAPGAQPASTLQDGDAIYSRGASQAFMRAQPESLFEAEPSIDPEVSAAQATLQQQGTAAAARLFGDAPTRSLAGEFQDIPGINLSGVQGSLSDAAAGVQGGLSDAVAGVRGALSSGVDAAVEAGESIGQGVAGTVDALTSTVSGAVSGITGSLTSAGEAIAEGGGFDPAGLIVGGVLAIGGLLADIFGHHHSTPPPPPDVPTAAYTAGLPSD